MNTVSQYSIDEFLAHQGQVPCSNLVALLTEDASNHHETNRAKLVSFDGKVFHYRNVRFYSNQVESVIMLDGEAVANPAQQSLAFGQARGETSVLMHVDSLGFAEVGEKETYTVMKLEDTPADKSQEENHEDEQQEKHEESSEGQSGETKPAEAVEKKPEVKTLDNAFRKGGKNRG